MRLKDYITEEKKLKVGDYVMQKQSDYNIFALLVSQLKNGAFKAVICHTDRPGPAILGSTKGWYPPPVKIGKMKIDRDTLGRIHKKAEKHGYTR